MATTQQGPLRTYEHKKCPRPISSPGGITESPLAKIAKVPHAGKVASPGNKSATPSHCLSPSRDASESNNSRRERTSLRSYDNRVRVRVTLQFLQFKLALYYAYNFLKTI